MRGTQAKRRSGGGEEGGGFSDADTAPQRPCPDPGRVSRLLQIRDTRWRTSRQRC